MQPTIFLGSLVSMDCFPFIREIIYHKSYLEQKFDRIPKEAVLVGEASVRTLFSNSKIL